MGFEWPDPGQILGGPTQPELYFGWPEWPEVSDITWDIAHAWQAPFRKKYALVPTYISIIIIFKK